MLKYSKTEMRAYVETRLQSAKIIEAKKIGNTIAFQGTVGQEVISLEIDKDGNEYVERIATVTLDPKTNKPGWILTKTGSDNLPKLNKFGHMNQYIVMDSIFKSMYEKSNDGPNLYCKSKVEKFIKSDTDITFDAKYGEIVVTNGGYIKVTSLDDISGISEESFNDTYEIINQKDKVRKH